MLNKFLNGQSKTITGAAILISGATLISRIVGLLRERIFAHYYGANHIMDAYYAAFKMPDLVYNLLIVGAISAGFIPVFVSILIKGVPSVPDFPAKIICPHIGAEKHVVSWKRGFSPPI